MIEIIPLALKKIKLRKIPLKWIEETVDDPEQIVEGYGNRKIYQKIYFRNNRKMLLRVVLEKDLRKNVVVTVYLTSQIERYLK